MPKDEDDSPKHGKYEDWWDKKSDNDTKKAWHNAVEDFVDSTELVLRENMIDIPLVKNIIPYIASEDRRWKRFPQDASNTYKYKMHECLYNTIRNKLDSLFNAKKKQLADQEKRKKEAEKQQAAEQDQDQDAGEEGEDEEQIVS